MKGDEITKPMEGPLILEDEAEKAPKDMERGKSAGLIAFPLKFLRLRTNGEWNN